MSLIEADLCMGMQRNESNQKQRFVTTWKWKKINSTSNLLSVEIQMFVLMIFDRFLYATFTDESDGK